MTTGGWTGTRVAVVGGAGFIGSNATLRLVELGAEVTVVDGLVPGCGGHRANLRPVVGRVRFVEADLTRDPPPPAVAEAEVVLDLMGDPAHGRSVANPLGDLANNLTAQVALYESLRNARSQARVVLASTRQVYGRCERLPVDETFPVAPPDPNAIHKVAAEQYATLYEQLYGIPSVRLRFTNVYGPRQGNRDPAHGVAGFLIGRLLRGERVTLFGGGEQRRDWLFVDDAVEALLLAAMVPIAAGRAYNIGHDRPASLREFVAAAQRAVGGGEVVEAPFPSSAAAIDIGDYWTDARRAAADLGWKAETSLAAGVAATVAFHRAEPNGAQWPS